MLQDTPSFLAYWRHARSRTVRVLEALRPEDLEWAPVPGAFSFGDLFPHLAGLERFMYAENAQVRPSTYPGHSAARASFDEHLATPLRPRPRICRRSGAPGRAQFGGDQSYSDFPAFPERQSRKPSMASQVAWAPSSCVMPWR